MSASIEQVSFYLGTKIENSYAAMIEPIVMREENIESIKDEIGRAHV